MFKPHRKEIIREMKQLNNPCGKQRAPRES